jgi:CRISPR type III-A-associated RAMP protein Csm4
MKSSRIPLQPYSHFHFGEFKIDSNVALSTTSYFAHSDTLFSALVESYMQGIGDASEFVENFKSGLLSISSLFYYLKKEDDIVYLLPKPVFLDVYSPRDGKHKLRNQIKFISKGVWEAGFDCKAWTESSDYVFIQNHDILLTKREFEILGLKNSDIVFSIVDVPKSPIRKNNDDESIYYQADLVIGGITGVEIGFYFLFEAAKDQENKIKQAINLMVHSGIGGERNNTGRAMLNPLFEEEFTLTIEENPSYEKGYTNISLFNPLNAQELEAVTFSQAILRGGRKTGNGEYHVIRMIREGSLISGDFIKGQLVDIGKNQEGKTAYRNGKGFNLQLTYCKTNE